MKLMLYALAVLSVLWGCEGMHDETGEALSSSLSGQVCSLSVTASSGVSVEVYQDGDGRPASVRIDGKMVSIERRGGGEWKTETDMVVGGYDIYYAGENQTYAIVLNWNSQESNVAEVNRVEYFTVRRKIDETELYSYRSGHNGLAGKALTSGCSS